jgi:hypothetical protein
LWPAILLTGLCDKKTTWKEVVLHSELMFGTAKCRKFDPTN